VPHDDEPTREPILKKWFFGSSAHTEREEKVLQYIIHRVNEETPLQDVMRDDYVRRNCSEDQIHELVNDPAFVHACRERLWQTFRSGELDPSRGHRKSRPSTNDSPADGADVSDPASPAIGSDR
jgi:hypothetical protein